MVLRKVRVEAPASSANLGAGFDVFALALREPFDVLTLEPAARGVELSTDGADLPSGKRNAAWAVANAILTGEGIKEGVKLRLLKGVPVGLGLGSSAASSAAAAVGMNALFELDMSTEKIIGYAGMGEKVASGAAHYDNVTAAIAGGFVIVSQDHSFVPIDAPAKLALCLAIPAVRLPPEKTKFARTLVPRDLPLEGVVGAVAAASRMVHGFASGNIDEIGEAMRGGFVDASRAKMVPGFERVRHAALDKGAAGVCISGAGPALLAVTTEGRAKGVLGAMRGAFEHEGVKSSGLVTKVGEGCRVHDQK